MRSYVEVNAPAPDTCRAPVSRKVAKGEFPAALRATRGMG